VWPRPFKEKDTLANYSGCVTTSEYLYATLDPRWPRFKLRLRPQRDETDAQYAAYRRDIEHNTMVHAIYLCMMHQLYTVIGNHETCAVPTARPLRRATRRGQGRDLLRGLPALHSDRHRHHRNLPRRRAGCIGVDLRDPFGGRGADRGNHRAQGDCHGRIVRLAGFHSGGG
jgi:hypothetical protein